MANITTYAANKVNDHLNGRAAFAMPVVYVSLFTTTPVMPAGTGGVEVSGGAYARVALLNKIGASASGSSSNSAAIVWATATADWGIITGVGLNDALTAGNLLAAGPLSQNQQVLNGGTFSFAIGALSDQFV